MVNIQSAPSPLSAIDPKRVAANAAVLVVHALAFAALMLPSSWEPPAPRARPKPPVVIEEYVKPKEIPLTQPPPIVRIVQPEVRPVQPTPTIADIPPVDTTPVFDAGEIAAQVVDDVGPAETVFDPGPQLETLGYAENPAPRYPRPSIQRHEEGRVLLRVLVDAQGRPQEVLVEKGSGHRDLDRAAREQVLAKWRFHPAQRGGRAVPAWALVPIDFVLP